MTRKVKPPPELTAVYYVGDLAARSGMTRWSMRRLLDRWGITVHGDGPRFSSYVFLSDIEAKCPQLWESLELSGGPDLGPLPGE